ncbi:BatA domain-containing protein [Rosistilla oblonga]|uniref:BatA domain-containing protein n=1 Tax=Rosistilla oblonga TaxID=2527990 RepID=UPI003A9837A0
MSFLNVALLGGLAAFAIPLIIHLLNRSKFKTLDWGAMHLLDSVVANNSRRVRLEQLLLLLIRCAIPALLAFCLARPVLTGWQSLPGDAPASTVILLDNSYSMDAIGASGTRIAEAVDDTRLIVDSSGKGSDTSVILTGGSPAPMFDTPVFDSKSITDQLPFLDSGRGATSLADSLELGASVVSAMANSRRNLILISDFQRSDVDALTPAAIEQFRQQIDSQAVPPSITLIQRSGDAEQNIAIEDVQLSTRALGVGQQLKVRVRVKNYGVSDVPEARLQFIVDDRLVGVTELAVAGDATAQALFVHKFDAAGSHVLKFDVDAGDDLKTDNQYLAVVDVIDSIEVLMIDGDPSRKPMESETDFLAVALTPFSLGQMPLADLVETRIVKTDEVDQQTLEWARVVIMANVAKLDDDRTAKLQDFVQRGGGLIVFTGNKVDVDWYNRVLHQQRGLFPLPIQGIGGGLDDGDRGARIVAQHFEHPALQIFNSGNSGSSELAQADIAQWYVLTKPASTSDNRIQAVSNKSKADASGIDPQASTLIRLDSGDPLWVEKPVGKGFVMACATTADADWNNLPLRPVFLPLVQQLVTSIATRGVPASNLTAGETLVALYDAAAADTTQVLSLPGNKQRSLRPVADQQRSVIRYAGTNQPGLYTLTQPDAPPRHFAVEIDRGESKLETIDAEQLQTLADALGADVVTDGAAFLALDSSRRHGREIWRLVLFALLGLLFVELFFQQRFSRVRQ